jgi:hypothetical protein
MTIPDVVRYITAAEFPSAFEERLAAIDAAGTLGKISALTFALAQLPFLAGVLGIGHLLRARAPIMSNFGTSLAVIGVLGHSVFGGLSMAYLSIAADEQNRATHAALMEKSNPVRQSRSWRWDYSAQCSASCCWPSASGGRR